MRRALGVLLAAAVVAIAGVPGRAQDIPQPEGFVRLASITPWIDRERGLRVGLQIANTSEVALEDVAVRVSIHAPVSSRSQLRASLDGPPATRLLQAFSQPVAPALAPGEAQRVTIERHRAHLRAFGRTGVYPLEIGVTHARGETVLRTAVPALAGEPERRLNVAWVLPVTRPVATPPDGSYRPEALAGLRLPELGQQMDAIARRDGLAVTLVPSPALLDTLSDLTDGFAATGPLGAETRGPDAPEAQAAARALERLRAAAGAVGEVATTTYAPVNVPALARAGLTQDLVRQVTLGRSVVEQRLGRSTSLTLVPSGAVLDARSSEQLEPVAPAGLLVEPALLPEGVGDRSLRPDLFGLSQPVEVRSGTRLVRTLVPDAAIRDRLEGSERGVLAAQAVIAETASAWLEIPERAEDRLVVLSSRTLLAPSALSAAMGGLRRAPWVRLRTAEDALIAFPPAPEPVTLPALPPRGEDEHLRAAADARRALGILDRIVVQPPAEAGSLDRLVLLAESAQWEEQPAGGRALAHAVAGRVARVLAEIRVFSRPVTLTARAGEVPVTVLNGNPFPVRVRLRLDSPKVAFPEGSSRTVELPASSATFGFSVRARAAGSFPLDVHVETPDGARLLASGQLTLRSTAVSAVSLVVVGGSAVFLLVAWVRRAQRRDGPTSR